MSVACNFATMARIRKRHRHHDFDPPGMRREDDDARGEKHRFDDAVRDHHHRAQRVIRIGKQPTNLVTKRFGRQYVERFLRAARARNQRASSQS